MKALPKIIAIAGVAYVAYYAMRAGDAQAGELVDTGAGVILRPADNTRAAQLSPQDVAEICARANADAGTPFDVADLMAICFVESSWRPAAYRYEAGINDASYGLFQTLYATAQEMGYGGSPDGLFDPDTSAIYGVRYLVFCRDFMSGVMGGAPGWLDILSCYNGGPGRAKRGWRNNDYYGKFLQARRGIAQ